MSLDERVQAAEAESRADRARVFLPWVVLGFIAVLVFELFAHPLLAMSVLCLKFGFNDFLTARWLVRRDPVRGRGWACGLLYAAAGFWKAAVINFALFAAAVIFTLVSGVPAWPQRPPNAQAANLLDDPLVPWILPSLLADAIDFLFGFAVVILAYSAFRKVWLSPRIHMARRLDEWPPTDDKGVNWLRWPAILPVAAIPIVIWLGALPFAFLIPTPAAVNAKDWEDIPLLLSFFGLILSLPVVLIAACVQDRNSRYLLAATPEECWGASDQESAPPSVSGL